LSRLQAQQAHQLQAINVKWIYRKGVLAAQLGVEMAAGLHVPETKLVERSRRWTVVTLGGLMGPASGGPAFTTVHIGAFRPLERSAG